MKTGKNFKSIFPPSSDGGKEYELCRKIDNADIKGIKGGLLRFWMCRAQEMGNEFYGFSIFFNNFLKKVKRRQRPPLIASRIELVMDVKYLIQHSGRLRGGKSTCYFFYEKKLKFWPFWLDQLVAKSKAERTRRLTVERNCRSRNLHRTPFFTSNLPRN